MAVSRLIVYNIFMKEILPMIQIVVGILLSVCVLLQAKGTGLGRSMGPTSYHQRRGVEILLFRATIALAVIFVVFSIIGQFLP